MPLRITLFLSTLVTIALVHIVSIELYLYWKYLWLDIPMHVLGGIACVLGFSILPFYNIVLSKKYTTWAWYSFATLVIGIAWEVFEVYSGFSVIEPGFVRDTAIDLCMDVVGASIGYGIITSLSKAEL